MASVERSTTGLDDRIQTTQLTEYRQPKLVVNISSKHTGLTWVFHKVQSLVLFTCLLMIRIWFTPDKKIKISRNDYQQRIGRGLGTG
jgi:hypothetical protein